MIENIVPASEYLVSVRLITFNHEKYIASALEGALMQRTSFPFEIVVADDSSTDRTLEILEQYHLANPGRIRVLPDTTRLGAKENVWRAYLACTGKYIAHLDGDDYWTDPYKLQQQVEVLESQPGMVACFHNMEVRYEDPQTPSCLYCNHIGKLVLTRFDLAARNVIPASGNMFRNGLVSARPDWFAQLPFGDWAWHILLLEQGDAYFLPKVMGVYRNHPNGIWSSSGTDDSFEKKLRVFDILIENYKHDPKFVAKLRQSRKEHLRSGKHYPTTKPSLKNQVINALIYYLKKL